MEHTINDTHLVSRDLYFFMFMCFALSAIFSLSTFLFTQRLTGDFLFGILIGMLTFFFSYFLGLWVAERRLQQRYDADWGRAFAIREHEEDLHFPSAYPLHDRYHPDSFLPLSINSPSHPLYRFSHHH